MSAEHIAALEAENRMLRAELTLERARNDLETLRASAALEALPELSAALQMKGGGRPDVIEDAARLTRAIIEERPAEAELAHYNLRRFFERRTCPEYIEARRQLDSRKETAEAKTPRQSPVAAVLAQLEAQQRRH